MTSEPPTFDQVKDYARRDAFAIGWQARQAMQLSHSTAIAFDIVLKSSCYWHETKTTLSEALEDWEQRHHGVGWFFYCTRFSTYNITYNDVSALPVFTSLLQQSALQQESNILLWALAPLEPDVLPLCYRRYLFCDDATSYHPVYTLRIIQGVIARGIQELFEDVDSVTIPEGLPAAEEKKLRRTPRATRLRKLVQKESNTWKSLVQARFPELEEEAMNVILQITTPTLDSQLRAHATPVRPAGTPVAAHLTAATSLRLHGQPGKAICVVPGKLTDRVEISVYSASRATYYYFTQPDHKINYLPNPPWERRPPVASGTPVDDWGEPLDPTTLWAPSANALNPCVYCDGYGCCGQGPKPADPTARAQRLPPPGGYPLPRAPPLPQGRVTGAPVAHRMPGEGVNDVFAVHVNEDLKPCLCGWCEKLANPPEVCPAIMIRAMGEAQRRQDETHGTQGTRHKLSIQVIDDSVHMVMNEIKQAHREGGTATYHIAEEVDAGPRPAAPGPAAVEYVHDSSDDECAAASSATARATTSAHTGVTAGEATGQSAAAAAVLYDARYAQWAGSAGCRSASPVNSAPDSVDWTRHLYRVTEQMSTHPLTFSPPASRSAARSCSALSSATADTFQANLQLAVGGEEVMYSGSSGGLDGDGAGGDGDGGAMDEEYHTATGTRCVNTGLYLDERCCGWVSADVDTRGCAGCMSTALREYRMRYGDTRQQEQIAEASAELDQAMGNMQHNPVPVHTNDGSSSPVPSQQRRMQQAYRIATVARTILDQLQVLVRDHHLRNAGDEKDCWTQHIVGTTFSTLRDHLGEMMGTMIVYPRKLRPTPRTLDGDGGIAAALAQHNRQMLTYLKESVAVRQSALACRRRTVEHESKMRDAIYLSTLGYRRQPPSVNTSTTSESSEEENSGGSSERGAKRKRSADRGTV